MRCIWIKTLWFFIFSVFRNKTELVESSLVLSFNDGYNPLMQVVLWPINHWNGIWIPRPQFESYIMVLDHGCQLARCRVTYLNENKKFPFFSFFSFFSSDSKTRLGRKLKYTLRNVSLSFLITRSKVSALSGNSGDIPVTTSPDLDALLSMVHFFRLLDLHSSPVPCVVFVVAQ